MREISEKIKSTKTGHLNPNAKPVKCRNVNTGEEVVFKTVTECKEYFGENTHRFITNRVKKQTVVPYKNEWQIAYVGDEYVFGEKHKTGKIVCVENIQSGKADKYYSMREAERMSGIKRSLIKDGAIIDNLYKISILN